MEGRVAVLERREMSLNTSTRRTVHTLTPILFPLTCIVPVLGYVFVCTYFLTDNTAIETVLPHANSPKRHFEIQRFSVTLLIRRQVWRPLFVFRLGGGGGKRHQAGQCHTDALMPPREIPVIISTPSTFASPSLAEPTLPTMTAAREVRLEDSLSGWREGGREGAHSLTPPPEACCGGVLGFWH